MNLQTGAFGDPAATDTLILFWTKMEELHYPGAASTKAFLEERLEREQQAAAQQAQMAAQAQMMGQAGNQGAGIPAGITQAIDERARQDAMAAAGAI